MAIVFLISMYVHIFCSIAIPITILIAQEWNFVTIGLLLLYLCEVLVVQILGWVCIGVSGVFYRKGKQDALRKAVKVLKIWSIPFYILNFVYSVFAWFALVGASRGILIFLVPIPICITYSMIIQSGCIGCMYIASLRKQEGYRPHGIHYFLQFVSVLDVISSLILFQKTKKEKVE